eukprot:14599236-Ditylum_brightwellii.AAC.1
MSAKECHLHIGNTEIVDRLILPEEVLDKKKEYNGKLTGYCPEINVLDTNFKKDTHDKVCHHVSKTP